MVPPATVIYAVGDIHGRLDLLTRATDEIAAAGRAAQANGSTVVAVFLGDYIDRGPDARGVIDHLLRFRDSSTCRCVFLRGNHEDVLLRLVDGEERNARWLEYGGLDTLHSYGAMRHGLGPREPVERLREVVAEVIPEDHLAFLRKTQLYVQYGDYVFVHAGLRPDRLLEEQSDADLMWFRYYDDEAPVWPHTVVHGHSVNTRPVKGRSRIGVDTGAYASNALTMLRLEDARQDLIKIHLAGDGRARMGPWEDFDTAFSRDELGPHSVAPAHAPPTPAASPASRRGEGPAPAAEPQPAVQSRARQAGAARGWILGAVVLAGAAAAAAAVTLRDREAVVDAQPALRGAQPARVGWPQSPAESPALRAAIAMGPLTNQTAPAQDAFAATGPRPLAAPGPVARTPVVSAQPPAAGAQVQIGAFPTRADAEAAQQAAARRTPDTLRGASFQVAEAEVDGRTVYRAIAAGFKDRAAAAEACRRFVAAGQACFVRAP